MPPVLPILAGVGLIGGAKLVGSALLATALTRVGTGLVLSGIGSLFRKSPSVPLATLERFSPSLSTREPRKIVVGKGPMATDVRYIEPSGTDDEYVDAIIVLASHRCHSVLEIYLGSDLAWTQAGGVQSKFIGYLTVNVVLEGTAGNAIPVGFLGVWNANSRLTGCCYLRLRIKRSGNSKKTRSPLESGLPGTIRVIGEGLPVYDPRRDSTRGGDGAHRADDQSSWAFYDGGEDLGGNPYLQAVTIALGWRVGGKVMVGAGLDPDIDIDLDSAATAASIADEAISLTGGGTQKRWRTTGIFSTAEGWREIADKLMLHSNGEVDDSTGQIRFLARHNDLASPALSLSDDDVVGPASYDVDIPLGPGLYNAVRGQFSDAAARYELRDYVEVAIASPDGIERAEPLDLWMHTDGRMAQRAARLRLQAMQWPGRFAAPFGKRALQLNMWDVVELTYGPLEFDRKLFRVAEPPQIEALSGRVQLVLTEEDPAIYSGDGDEDAPVAVPPPVLFDERQTPPVPLDYEFVGGPTRPDDYATRGDNVQPNWDLREDTTGYNLGGAWERVAAPAGFLAPFVLRNTVAASAPGSALIFPRVTVTPNDFVYARVRVRRSAALGDLVVVANMFSDPVSGGGIGPLAGAVVTAVPTAVDDVQEFEIYGRVDSNTRGIEVWIEDLAGATVGTVWIGDARVASSQQGADVTADTVPRLELPTPQTFQAAFDGTISAGQQPRDLQVRRFRGSVDVTSSTSWSATGVGCTASITSAGLLTISNVTASGRVDITGTRDGVPVSGSVETRLARADPPPASGSPTAGGSISFSSNSASFVTAVTATVTTTASGTSVSIATDVFTVGDAGFANTEVVWQRETSPGTWSDIGAVVVPDFYSEYFGFEFGYASISRTVTGLASSTAHNFRLRVRRTSAPVANQNYSGSYTVAAT